MNRTKFIGGLLFFFLRFGRGLCGDTWPSSAVCPGGTDRDHEETFDWALSDPDTLKSLFVSNMGRSFTGASFHKNSSRMINCGPNSIITSNLCHPKNYVVDCAMQRTRICFRSETKDYPLFATGNYETVFAMHDYHCDNDKNKMYYAVILRKSKISDTKGPKNFKPEINIVSTSDGLKLMTTRFYFFHHLPKLAENGNKGAYYAVGFLYIQVVLTEGIVGLINNIVPVGL